MSEAANRHSPLATVIGGATPLELDGLQIAELPFLGHLNLRLDSTNNTALVDAAETAIGLELPLEPNRSTGSSTQAALWLAPDEWLLLAPQDRQVALVEELEHSLADEHFAVNDISSGQTLISVTGVAARELLARGCSIDVHPRKFVPGRCAQTLFAKATVLICQWDDDPPAYGLIVRRSFADHLWTWLADAARDAV